MTFPRFVAATAAIACLALPVAALAHATLAQSEAVAGRNFLITANVPHGCDGSPTLKVRVKVPDGVVGVKPQPKAGWQVETVVGKLAKPYEDHGKTITEGVTEVVWTGKLLDAHFDQFSLRGMIPDVAPGTVLYVPIVQECEKGVHRWIEIPAAGQKPADLKEPAPFIRVLAKP